MSVEAILKAAAERADEAEVCISTGQSLSAELKRRQIEIGSLSDGTGLIIRTITDGRIGISSTDNPAAWEKCLDAAIASSRFSDQVDWKGLPGPRSLDQQPLAYDPKIQTEPGLVTDLINRMLNGAASWPAEVTGGGVSVTEATHTIANSTGLWYETRETNVTLSLEMIAGQSTGYEFDAAWNLEGVNPEKVGEDAAFFAARGQDGREIPTGSYDVVLSPLALSRLLEAAITPALSGRSVHTGRSFFAGKMGTQVADSRLSLTDDPFDPRGMANCPWDGEGTPVQKTGFITEGILSSYAYDLKTAYRYGENPTGHAVRSGMAGAPGIGHHNLILNAATRDVMDDDAIYIHDLIGAHTANPLSGDFSVELSGPFFTSGGRPEDPIRTAMLSGNIFDLLQKVEGSSRETRTIGSLILPSVRFPGLSIVGRG